MRAAWAREHGLAVPRRRRRARRPRATPFPAGCSARSPRSKPILRPLARKVGLSPRLDAEAEKVLLAQIEDFKPDLVLNQDLFHVDTRLARRIKQIGRPILIGQTGISPLAWRGLVGLRPHDLPDGSIVEFFRRHGARAEVVHLAFEPSILEALPPPPLAKV